MKPQIYEEWIVFKEGGKLEKIKKSARGKVSIDEDTAAHNNEAAERIPEGQKGLLYVLKSPAGKTLNQMSKEELIQKAIELEIPVEDSLTKKQLIEKIEEKQ